MSIEQERDNWIETAKQHCRNEFFYRDIIHQIGIMFGEEAKTSDDGRVQDEVLALKVPELAGKMIRRNRSMNAILQRWLMASESINPRDVRTMTILARLVQQSMEIVEE